MLSSQALSRNPFRFTLLITSVFGLGAVGCDGCGLAPIPGGFPSEERIPNAAQIRLTSHGLQFVESNLGAILDTLLPGGLRFNVDAISTSVDTGFLGDTDIDICRDNDCAIQAEVSAANVTAVEPDAVRASIDLVVDARTRTGERRALPVRVDPPILGSTRCSVDLDTRRGARDHVTVEIEVGLAEEAREPRAGLTAVDVRAIGISPTAGVEDADVTDPDCSGISGFIVELISGLVKDDLVDGFLSSLESTLREAIESELCTRPTSAGCPQGTFPLGGDDDAVCVFEGTEECAPILLGADGQGDFGALLFSALSPYAHGPGQFLLASGGPAESVAQGLSLFASGGFRSTDRTFNISPGHDPCVPTVEPPPIPVVPRGDVFRSNEIPGSNRAAHIGVGLSESFLNYAAYGLYDSGALCLAVGTPLSQQLSSGLLSALIPGLEDLTFPRVSAPLSLALRPQSPPRIAVGDTLAGQPLLSLELPRLSIDLYVWSSERYVRFLTFTADVAIDADLRIEEGAIVPVIDNVRVSDAVITNDELVDAPADLAATMETLISVFAGTSIGSIDPVRLPSIMGFDLGIGPDGVLGFTDQGERFVGLFADLSLPSVPLMSEMVTEAALAELDIDPEGLTVEGWSTSNAPKATFDVSDSGPPGPREASYRIDGLPWSPWGPSDGTVVVQSDVFRFQGRHIVEIRSRAPGVRGEVARVDVIVDALAPTVAVESVAEGFRVRARDVVTPTSRLEARFRSDPAEDWSSWSRQAAHGKLHLPPDVIAVQVRDEAGNVGTARPRAVLEDRKRGCEAGGGLNSGDGWLALALLLWAANWHRRDASRAGGGAR